MQWLKRLLGSKTVKSDTPLQETEEIFIIAKCIGCGQCANGCPLRIKIKVPVQKDKSK